MLHLPKGMPGSKSLATEDISCPVHCYLSFLHVQYIIDMFKVNAKGNTECSTVSPIQEWPQANESEYLTME